MTTVDPNKIETLKQTLIKATEFTEIAEVFLDDLGNDPAFFNAGEQYDDKTFASIVARAAAAAAGTTVAVFVGHFMRIPEHRMIHGAFDLGAWSGMMFYFEGIDKGFIALGNTKGANHFLRFTALPSKGESKGAKKTTLN